MGKDVHEDIHLSWVEVKKTHTHTRVHAHSLWTGGWHYLLVTIFESIWYRSDEIQQRPNSATHHRTMNDGTPNLSIKEIKIDYNFLANRTVEQFKKKLRKGIDYTTATTTIICSRWLKWCTVHTYLT